MSRFRSASSSVLLRPRVQPMRRFPHAIHAVRKADPHDPTKPFKFSQNTLLGRNPFVVELVARTSCTKSSEQRRPFAFRSRMFQKVGDTPDMQDYKRNLGVPFRDSTEKLPLIGRSFTSKVPMMPIRRHSGSRLQDEVVKVDRNVHAGPHNMSMTNKTK